MAKLTRDEWMQQEYMNRRAEELSKVFIPAEIIDKRFKDLLHKALMHNGILLLKCGMATYHALVFLKRQLVYPEFELALDILRACTPVEMGMTLEEYFMMQHEVVAPMEIELNKIGKPIEDRIRGEVETKANLYNGVPAEKKIYRV